MFDINKVDSYLDYMELQGIDHLSFRGGEQLIIVYGCGNAYSLELSNGDRVIDDKRDVFIKRVVDKMLGGV